MTQNFKLSNLETGACKKTFCVWFGFIQSGIEHDYTFLRYIGNVSKKTHPGYWRTPKPPYIWKLHIPGHHYKWSEKYLPRKPLHN